MVGQPEHPTYDPLVYEYEVTDPVQGGVGGIANLPLLNLANRTAYLKQRLDSLVNGDIIPPTIAPLNGPAFTGSTTAPNVRPGDDSTLIANTDFVQTRHHGLAVVTVGGNVSVTLTQDQWGVGILIFSGVLTGPVPVLFPAAPGLWTVANRATGSFDLTCKTAAGTGVIIPQVTPYAAIWCDGTSIFAQNSAPVANFANMLSFRATAGNWTCPAGVFHAKLRMWGAGAAGGASNANLAFGGGGGGGGYVEDNVAVVPGTVYPYVSGLRGAPTSNTGTPGQTSTMFGKTATGGAGGIGSASGGAPGGVGGTGTGGAFVSVGASGSFGYVAGGTNVAAVGGWAFGTSITPPEVAGTGVSVQGAAGAFPGGGGGGSLGVASGGQGGDGLIILEW